MIDPPLEAIDPQRAAVVKRKVLARLTDMARHFRALEAAMAPFGEGEQFALAAGSDDPTELNRVKAVERGVDQLFNYVAELAGWASSWQRSGRRTTSRAREAISRACARSE
jgi:hypothetical protein